MAAENNKGGDESMMAIILAAIVVVFVLVMTWVIFHTQISMGISWLREGQMNLAAHWIDEDRARMNVAPTKEMADMVRRHDGLKDPRTFKAWQDYVPEDKGAAYKFKDHGYLAQLALHPYKIPFVVMIGLMMIHIFLKGPMSQYRRQFGLNELIKEQAKTFSQIVPFIDFNPGKDIPARAPGDPVPVDLPPFAEALGPEEWLAYNRIPMPDGKLDERAARSAFQKNLGKRWRGPKTLKPHQQILLAAFCLKASRKRDEADQLLGRLATCWNFKKGLKLNKDRTLHADALKILRDKSLTSSTYAIMKQHAYETTAMMRALMHARDEGGVLAPAQFVWLRGYERSLWYPLNNLGRQSFNTEALACMAHYVEEKRNMRPIPVPQVEEAVKSLKAHMSSMDVKPVPPLDYGDNKKSKKNQPENKSSGIMKPVGSA